MPELDNTDKAILVELLRDTIERDRFPLSPQIKSLKTILAKLDAPPPASSQPIKATLMSHSRPRQRSVSSARKWTFASDFWDTTRRLRNSR